MRSGDVTLGRSHRVLGLLAAVIVAWALLVPLPFLADLANTLFWSPAWVKQAAIGWPQFGTVFVVVIFMAIFGLPLSLLYCVGLGYPAWLLASRLGFKRRRNAMAVGAILGMVLDLPLAALKMAGVLFTYGQKEPLSKLVLLYPGIGLYVVGVGVAAGLAAWWAAGAKSVDRNEEMVRLFA